MPPGTSAAGYYEGFPLGRYNTFFACIAPLAAPPPRGLRGSEIRVYNASILPRSGHPFNTALYTVLSCVIRI